MSETKKRNIAVIVSGILITLGGVLGFLEIEISPALGFILNLIIYAAGTFTGFKIYKSLPESSG